MLPKSRRISSVVALLALLCACNSELRGTQSPSPDGKTYLLFQELDGPACKTVYVNGKPWPYKLGIAGEVPSGETVVKCFGEIRFVIKAKHTFSFNYWGP